jgi:glyoxylase-like metal-dependent hydrolase (beta-lactamase superfamily II)
LSNLVPSDFPGTRSPELGTPHEPRARAFRAVRRLAGSALISSAIAATLAAAVGCERAPAADAPPSNATAAAAARSGGAAAEALRAATGEGPGVALLGAWTREVAPGVHLLGRTFPNASYVIETSDGLVLVDTCPEAGADPIFDQLDEIGLDVTRLRKILLTHAHADHCLGAARLAELSGAQICAGRGDAAVLRAGGPHEALCSVFAMPHDTHPTPVDVELSDGDRVRVGDTEIRAIATPGHTPGSVCYLLERSGLRVLFTGDVVMSLSDPTPLNGAGIYTAYLAPSYRGDAASYRASLRKLLAMEPPDVVLPGHPRLDFVPANAHMTRAAWETLLTRAIERLDLLLERRAEDGADFLDGHPKELLPGLRYLGDFEDGASYLLTIPRGPALLFGALDDPDAARTFDERCAAAGLGKVRPAAVMLSSCSPCAVAGLREFVETTGCAVVAPEDGLAALREICPPGTTLHAAESLAEFGGHRFEVVPIGGAAHPSVAYSTRWAGKTVVFTGSVPARIEQQDDAERRKSVARKVSRIDEFRRTLDRLERLDPDLWLPAFPTRSPNANLYDDEWTGFVRSNRW